MTHDYQRQDSQLTLREGLEEYHASFADLVDESDLAGTARELFHNHDICHVVFGCDTSLRHEVLVDVWTMFATDVGVGAYLDYLRVPEATGIIVETGIAKTLWESLRALPDVIRVIARSRRMRRRWSWDDHDALLDRPLAEIRRELGIDVLEQERAAQPRSDSTTRRKLAPSTLRM